MKSAKKEKKESVPKTPTSAEKPILKRGRFSDLSQVEDVQAGFLANDNPDQDQPVNEILDGLFELLKKFVDNHEALPAPSQLRDGVQNQSLPRPSLFPSRRSLKMPKKERSNLESPGYKVIYRDQNEEKKQVRILCKARNQGDSPQAWQVREAYKARYNNESPPVTPSPFKMPRSDDLGNEELSTIEPCSIVLQSIQNLPKSQQISTQRALSFDQAELQLEPDLQVEEVVIAIPKPQIQAPLQDAKESSAPADELRESLKKHLNHYDNVLKAEIEKLDGMTKNLDSKSVMKLEEAILQAQETCNEMDKLRLNFYTLLELEAGKYETLIQDTIAQLEQDFARSKDYLNRAKAMLDHYNAQLESVGMFFSLDSYMEYSVHSAFNDLLKKDISYDDTQDVTELRGIIDTACEYIKDYSTPINQFQHLKNQLELIEKLRDDFEPTQKPSSLVF